ncbi:MAG TPA: hypothetical protein VLE49_01700 [Anaerolineales bacterium]|nr:hypothetical protein [Anaerolineales bacterium]
MQSNVIRSVTLVFAIILIALPACSMSGETVIPPSPTLEEAPLIPIAGPLATATVPPTQLPSATSTVTIIHTMTPADPRAGKLIYDVESAGTAPEKRAPYGDSYDINRLERPFTQDMNYVPGLDIATFNVTRDNDWWYVSIELVGIDPSNTPEINYGVELDLDHDGFGDYLIWAHPPYTNQWNAAPVQIYQDNNHNTAGLSIGKSDAPFVTDGYETLIFDGNTGGSDPDLAWIRVETGSPATVEFAFKQSWSGSVFMLGVIADAGLKDPRKLDYVDRFPIAEAGSPVKESKYYPLKALFLVDNTCRDAFGFVPSNYEPQLCPVPVAPSKTPDPDAPSGASCPDPGPNVCRVWDSVNCKCLRR